MALLTALDATPSFTHDALPGRVVFGSGARHGIPTELDSLGATRVLLIAGATSRGRGDEFAALLGDRVVARTERVVQHVPLACAAAAREAYREARADAVLAVGGGSAIGLGKAVALTDGARLIAVPTTYAGSEMTPIWGMTDGDRKTTGRDPRVLPSLVVYDPELTLDLPAATSGPSGLNALAHCVEATYGPGANPVTTLLALEGLRALAEALPEIVARPTELAARSRALYGAYLAGSALAVAGTALHHKTCHVLGGMFKLGHGEMNAVLLPYALRYNEPAIAAAHTQMARALHAGNAADALRELVKTIGAPRSLAEIGMSREGIEQAIPRVVEACRDNIRPPEPEGIREMLTAAFRGSWAENRG